MTRAASEANQGATGASWEARARTWAALAFGLAAVLGAAYWIFGVQVETRRRALEAQYAQSLAQVARRAEHKLEAYRRIGENALGFLEAVKGGSLASIEAEIGTTVLPSYREFLAQCQQEEPDAARHLRCFARKVASNAAQAALGDGFKLDDCPSAAAPLKAGSVVLEGERVYLRTRGGPWCFELSLAALLRAEDPADAANTTLDGLLLVDTQGNSVWQDPRSKLRVNRLPKLTPAHEQASRPAYSAMVKDVSLGSGLYRAFVEPLEIRLTSGPSGGLALCRLLREATLDAQSQRIDPISFLWAGLLLVLGVLSFPLAKLWLLAPRSRFRNSDLRLLLVSSALVTLVGTSVFMGFVARNRLNADLDTRLRERAEQVRDRLKHKMASAERSLDALTRRFDFSGSLPAGACPLSSCERMSRARFRDDGRERPVCECTRYRADGLYVRGPAGAAFRRASWTDAEGHQQLKLAPGTHATPPLSLASREYFRRAKLLGQTFLADGARAAQPASAVEIVRSKTSGAMVLISARATFDSREPRPDTPAELNGVLGVETSLEGFSAPLLPWGFVFAVIDEHGKIVLHSRNEAHEGRSIADEIGELQDVHALQRSGLLRVSYLGTDSRVYAEPISDQLWVLMIAPQALVDEPAQSVTLATLLSCTIALAAFFLLWLLIPFLRLGLHASHDTYGWLWRLFALTSFRPLPWLGARYVWLGIAFLIGAGLSYGVVLWLRPAPILCAALAVASAYTVYQVLLPRTATISLARAYALYCFGVGALVVVLPAVVAFAGSYHHFVASLARREADHLLQAIAQRPSCLRGTCEDLFALSLAEPAEPVPAPARGAPHQLGALAPDLASADPLGGWLDAPIHSALLRFPHLSQPWPPVPDGFALAIDEYALTLRASAPSQGSRVHRMELPRLLSTNYHLLRLICLLCAFAAAVVAAFFVWTRSVCRLFFLDALAAPTAAPANAAGLRRRIEAGAARPGATGRERALLYLYPGEALRHELAHHPAFVPFPGREPECTRILVVDDLSAHFQDEAVLSGLEHALGRGAKLVLFSRADPLLSPLGETRGRWLALLSQMPCAAGTRYAELHSDSPAAIARAWEECDADERRVLAQLAFDGHASPNPQNLPVIRKLVARGLLDPDTFELTHCALRAYVRSVSSTAALRAQEALDGGTPWNMLKIPITSFVLVLLAGVSYGQTDATSSALALPGFVVSVPLMLRALISVASARLASASGVTPPAG